MLSLKIERYITERITERLKIDDICDEFFISKNALYRLFRDDFKMTVNDFIIKK